MRTPREEAPWLSALISTRRCSAQPPCGRGAGRSDPALFSKGGSNSCRFLDAVFGRRCCRHVLCLISNPAIAVREAGAFCGQVGD